MTQDGLKVKLCIFLTRQKGYGIRAEEPIAKGTFLGHYGGVPKHARNLSQETRSHFYNRIDSARYKKYESQGDISINRCQEASEEFVALTGSTAKMRIMAYSNDNDLHDADNGENENLDLLHWLPENNTDRHNLLSDEEKLKIENEHHYVTGEFILDAAKYGTVCRYFNHTCGDETVFPQLGKWCNCLVQVHIHRTETCSNGSFWMKFFNFFSFCFIRNRHSKTDVFHHQTKFMIIAKTSDCRQLPSLPSAI